MIVRLTKTNKLQKSVLKDTIDLLTPFSGCLQFIEEKESLAFQNDYFLWDDFFVLCSKYRSENNISDDDFLVVLTELKNDSNWFSAFSPTGERTIFIQATDWENYIYCEPSYPIAYEIVENIFQSMVYQKIGDEFWEFVHQEPIGCMNDMCGFKANISLKLRSADICGDCLKIFAESMSEELLKQGIEIIEGLRKKMVFNTLYQKPLSFEENLPFSVAITKRKLSTTLEPFRKFLMLLDHFDSIVRTAVIMISHISKTKEEVYKFFKDGYLLDRPSLGHWVSALANLGKQTLNFDWESQLPYDFAENVKKVIQLTNDARITQIRNEKRGHGYISCHDSGYEKTFVECLPAIEEMEKILSPLFYGYKYYQVITSRRISTNNFRITTYNFSGSNPAFIEEMFTASFDDIKDIPIENHFYLVTPDKKKWYDLHPFFKYAVCNVCELPRLLVMDGVYVLDPYMGHRFENSN